MLQTITLRHLAVVGQCGLHQGHGRLSHPQRDEPQPGPEKTFIPKLTWIARHLPWKNVWLWQFWPSIKVLFTICEVLPKPQVKPCGEEQILEPWIRSSTAQNITQKHGQCMWMKRVQRCFLMGTQAQFYRGSEYFELLSVSKRFNIFQQRWLHPFSLSRAAKFRNRPHPEKLSRSCGYLTL